MDNQNNSSRLKRLENRLLHWNKGCVGKLDEKANELTRNISYFQRREEVDMLNEETVTLKKSCKDYLNTLKQIETKWPQKARLQWLKIGHDNTKFFHIKTKINKNKNSINWIKDSGNILKNNNEIMGECVSFFKKL